MSTMPCTSQRKIGVLVVSTVSAFAIPKVCVPCISVCSLLAVVMRGPRAGACTVCEQSAGASGKHSAFTDGACICLTIVVSSSICATCHVSFPSYRQTMVFRVAPGRKKKLPYNLVPFGIKTIVYVAHRLFL